MKATTYAKLDGNLWLSPKVAKVSDRGFRLWVTSISYCADRLTDGFVAASMLGMLTSYLDEPLSNDAVSDLVDAGLWIESDGGWNVSGYLDWNKSRAEIEEKRDRERARKASARNPQGVRAESARNPDGIRALEVEVEQELDNIKSNAHAVARAFATFWDIYPRKVGKRTAEAAFKRVAKRTDPQAVIDGAKRLRSDPNLPAREFIPHPTTWLNRDGWLDEPYGAENAPAIREIRPRCPEHEHMTQPCATCAAERAAGLREDTA